MTHQLNANAQSFVPFIPPDPATLWDELTPTQQAYRSQQFHREHNSLYLEKLAEELRTEAGVPEVIQKEKCDRMLHKIEKGNKCRFCAYEREKDRRRRMEERFTGRDFWVRKLTPPPSQPGSSSDSDPGPPRNLSPPRLCKYDPEVPLSIYWDSPSGMYSRTWTGVTGIGSGAEWGTTKRSGYGGIPHGKPQPIMEEEGETDYVLEKAYYR